MQLWLRQLQSWRHNSFRSRTFRAVGTFLTSLCQITHLTEANPCQSDLLRDNHIRRLVISASRWPRLFEQDGEQWRWLLSLFSSRSSVSCSLQPGSKWRWSGHVPYTTSSTTTAHRLHLTSTCVQPRLCGFTGYNFGYSSSVSQDWLLNQNHWVRDFHAALRLWIVQLLQALTMVLRIQVYCCHINALLFTVKLHLLCALCFSLL